MVGALLLSLHLLRPWIPWLRSHWIEAVAGALLFYPLTRAILGGQNTALTLLLLVAIWRLVADGRGFGAGLALAALFYKPQFALPLVGLFLLDRRWRALAGVGTGVVVLYALNASLMGADWLSAWWSQAVEFAGVDAAVNKHGSVSWVGFFQAVRGPSDPFGLAVGWTLTVSHIALLVYFWAFVERTDWAARFAVLSVGILLIPLHAMYYDVGVVLLALLVLAATADDRATWIGVGLMWPWALLQTIAPGLGFSPLFFLLVTVAIWTGLVFRRRAGYLVTDAVSAEPGAK